MTAGDHTDPDRPGLHVCALGLQSADNRGEWVEIANNGPYAEPLTGRLVSDYTATQQHVHVYAFPPDTEGGDLRLEPGRSVYLFSGHGRNERAGNGDLFLFAGRSAPIWNDDGDVAYLREADGTFISTMTVGHPKRHPGH